MSKKKRQRGSRTHGGGSHKKRRGAGHRGGRGRAGRTKHEKNQYPPRKKHGFERPEKAQETVETVNLQKLDEDAALLAAEGVAEETDDGYRVDAREVVDDGHQVDVVKVLASGQLRGTLEVVADDFSEAAEAQLESAGGAAILTERGEERAAERAEEPTTHEANPDE
jgi:large subunit ribosomal protein L15